MAYKNVDDRRAASRRHYLANKESYLRRNARYRTSIQDFIRRFKERTGCLDCGRYYPYYVMDFDHLESDKKEATISYLTATGRVGALKKELEKCQVVCANCHRIRTHARLNKISSLSSVD